MANSKISELTELAELPAATDVVAIVDTSATTTKKISIPNLIKRDGFYYVGTASSGPADYICDGVADDVQINAAMAQANTDGGGTVILLPGTYTTSSTIDMPSNVHLKGSGIDVTTVRAVNAYSDTGPSGGITMVKNLANPCAESSISDITFDGNCDNITGATSDGNNRLIDIQYATNFRFIDNKVFNGINYNVHFRFADGLWIERNYVTGGNNTEYDQGDGIHVTESNNVFIRGNYVDTYGIGVTGNGDDGIVIRSVNTGQTSATAVISDNIISSGTRGIALVAAEADVRNVLVANNVIKKSNITGLILDGAISDPDGKFIDVTITGNKLYDMGYLPTNDGNGIWVTSCSTNRMRFQNLVISNNTIRKVNSAANTAGIYIQGKGTGLTISGNQISELTGARGIRIGTASNPIKDAIITNNRLDLSTSASGVQCFNLYGIERGVVSGNEIYGHTTGTTYGMLIQADDTAGNDADGVPAIEPASYLNVTGNVFYNLDLGVVENSQGANPDNNIYSNNTFHTVTTEYTILGSNSFVYRGMIARTPASAAAAGTAGQIAYDASYIYICTATNTWERVAIASW